MEPTLCCRPGTVSGIFASPCGVFLAHFTVEETEPERFSTFLRGTQLVWQNQRDVCIIPSSSLMEE